MKQNGRWIKMWPDCAVYPGIIVRQFVNNREVQYEVIGPALIEGFVSIEEIQSPGDLLKLLSLRKHNVSMNFFLENKCEIFIEGLDPETEFPHSLNEAITMLDKLLSVQVKNDIRSMKIDSFIEGNHFNLGLYIRNNFGLYLGNLELIKDLKAEGKEAEEISSLILKHYYYHLVEPTESEMLLGLQQLHPDLYICLESRPFHEAHQQSAGVLLDMKESTIIIYLFSTLRWYQDRAMRSIQFNHEYLPDHPRIPLIITHREELYEIQNQSAAEIIFTDTYGQSNVIKFPWWKSHFSLIKSMKRIILFSLTDELKKAENFYFGFGNFGSFDDFQSYMDSTTERSFY
jgi:hypothetical protein